MSEITKEHLEWATVDRMHRMLIKPHDEFKVTHTFAIFTSLLCWIMQRIRARGNSRVDIAARGLYNELALETISGPIWMLTEREHLKDFNFNERAIVQTPGALFAADLLIAIRNSLAHGDARNVRPRNERGWLVGQEFSVYGPDNLWTGIVRLKRKDMKRIGSKLAGRFCDVMKDVQTDVPHFVEESRNLREQGDAR